MPQDFKDYFLALTNDELNVFPFVQEALAACPANVHRFRQQMLHLLTLPTPSLPSRELEEPSKSCSKHNRKISPKKLHEIEQLAFNIHDHCPDSDILLDLGSGLGYLSESLIKLNHSYLILGLEADNKRVHAARKRLSETSLKSISYKQEFVTADPEARARIESYVSELAQKNGLTGETRLTIMGLHACADLSVSAMQLFLRMAQAECLHIMPCCYHKLALQPDSLTAFVNFPLSTSLRKAMHARSDPSEVYSCFNRPFMRLACQETKSRWQADSCTHTEHGAQMFYRALATDLCDADEMVKVKRNAGIAVNSLVSQTFGEFQQMYQLHSIHTKHAVDWRPIHETRFNEICQRYPKECGSRLAEALRCLQATMQVISLFTNFITLNFDCSFHKRSSARTWCSTTVCAT